MKFKQKHNSSKEKVKNNIAKALERARTEKLPEGVELKNLDYEWTQDEINFSLKIKRGLLSLPVSGTILVDDNYLNIELKLPAMLEKALPEEELKKAFSQNFPQFLENPE